MMPAPTCLRCEDPKFNPSISGTKELDDIERTYVASKLKGSIWKDKACLDSELDSSCAYDFPFYSYNLKSETPLPKIQGVLGLG